MLKVLEAKERSFGRSGSGGEAAVLMEDGDLAVHADMNLNAGAGPGGAPGIRFELDAMVADPDGVVGRDETLEPEREDGAGIESTGELAVRAAPLSGFDRKSPVEGLEEGTEESLSRFR